MRSWLLWRPSPFYLGCLGAGLGAALPSPAAAGEGTPAAWLSWPLLIALLLLAVAGILAAWTWRSQRKLWLYQSAWAALPHPRQIVGASGKVVYANPAYHRFFGETAKPIPELLMEETDDEEAREQIERLAANARIGKAGQAEVPVRVRRPRDAGDLVADDSGDLVANDSGDLVADDSGDLDADDSGAESAAGGSAGGILPGTNGEVEWRSVAVYPVADARATAAPGPVFWQVDDITPRRQLAQVIHEEQARFVDLFDHAPIGFYSVDHSGRFLLVNRTLGEWLGLDPAEIIGRELRLCDLLENTPPPGTPPYDPIGAGGATGAGSSGEVLMRGAEGQSFTALISQDLMTAPDGGVIRTRSVVRHLSQEQEMVDALARSERRFERFFEDAPVGIALLDEAGVIKECNHRMLSLVDADRQLLVGSALETLVSDESHDAIQAGLAQCKAMNGAGGADTPIEVRMRRNQESICAVFMTPVGQSAAVGQSAGGGGGIIVHFIDTTEQKNLELQFVQSQKMQAVGQLAGGIAHDFNNLLTAMIGFSDLLLLRHQPGDQSFADIMQIKQNAIRAGNLVRQLLAFSRQQTLQPRVLSITDILAELSHLLRRLIGENIELKMVHGRDLGPVKADQVQLEQVIINLAVNARDAMAQGGQLTIQTDNCQVAQQTKYRGEVIPPGSYSRIRASDTGCGIDEEILDRIFEPFFSTKEVGDGTGLGLSTVYGIVKQTGGFVYVDSKIGSGTTFTILLPLHSAVEEQESPAEEAAVEPGRDLTGMGTVLLVEDEEAVRAFSARALRDKGYNVLEAPSGEAALELLKEDIDPIDLLITDVVMPKLDGPALVREVRIQRPDLSVIFISGYTEDTFRRRLDREAGIHFLPKPFTLKQLAGKVKEVMHETGGEG